MFGWEFPPHIAGGLGTACYGMTRGLARNGVDVTFIVPHAYGDEDQRFTHVVNASDVEATLRAGYDVAHGLIGAGVYASHGYERSHIEGVYNTLKVLCGYLEI